jgi:hypothetical protein
VKIVRHGMEEAPPNGFRLSGDGGAADGVRCSRELDGTPPRAESGSWCRCTAPVEPNEQRNAECERPEERKSQKPRPLYRAERLAGEKVAEQKGRQQDSKGSGSPDHLTASIGAGLRRPTSRFSGPGRREAPRFRDHAPRRPGSAATAGEAVRPSGGSHGLSCTHAGDRLRAGRHRFADEPVAPEPRPPARSDRQVDRPGRF